MAGSWPLAACAFMAECKASFTGTGPCKRRGHSAFPDGSAIAVTALLKPWWREAQRTYRGSYHLLMMAHLPRTSPASTKEMRKRAHGTAHALTSVTTTNLDGH